MSKMLFKKRRIYEDLGGIRPHGVGYRYKHLGYDRTRHTRNMYSGSTS